jgi:hypothetical protein
MLVHIRDSDFGCSLACGGILRGRLGCTAAASAFRRVQDQVHEDVHLGLVVLLRHAGNLFAIRYPLVS